MKGLVYIQNKKRFNHSIKLLTESKEIINFYDLPLDKLDFSDLSIVYSKANIENFKKGIELITINLINDIDDIKSMILKSYLLIKVYDFKSAIYELDKIEIKNNSLYYIYQLKSECYEATDNDDIALFYIDKAINLNNSNPYLYSHRAFLKRILDYDYKIVLDDYNQSISLDPSGLSHLNNYGYTLYLNGYTNNKEFKEVYDRCTENIKNNSDGDNSNSFYLIAWQEYVKKNYKSALNYINEGLKCNKKTSLIKLKTKIVYNLYLNYGDNLQYNKNKKQPEEYWQDVNINWIENSYLQIINANMLDYNSLRELLNIYLRFRKFEKGLELITIYENEFPAIDLIKFKIKFACEIKNDSILLNKEEIISYILRTKIDFEFIKHLIEYFIIKDDFYFANLINEISFKNTKVDLIVENFQSLYEIKLKSKLIEADKMYETNNYEKAYYLFLECITKGYRLQYDINKFDFIVDYLENWSNSPNRAELYKYYKDYFENGEGASNNYSLPLKYCFNFGKYKDNNIRDVLYEDPGYIAWCILNIDWFMIKSNLLIHHKFVLLPNFRKVYLLNTLKNYFKEEEIDYSGLIESEIYSEYILQQRQNYSDTFGLNQDTIDDLLDGNVDNYLNID